MSDNEWKSLAKCKSAEASIIWVREAQVGADSCGKDMNYEKLQALAESNSVKPNSGSDDMARFGEVALEAAKNLLEDSKAINQFADNTVYCRVTSMPKFQMGVLGNQLCVNSNAGRESYARQYQRSEFWYQREAEASNRTQVMWKNTVFLDDAAVLIAALRVPRTLCW